MAVRLQRNVRFIYAAATTGFGKLLCYHLLTSHPTRFSTLLVSSKGFSFRKGSQFDRVGLDHVSAAQEEASAGLGARHSSAYVWLLFFHRLMVSVVVRVGTFAHLKTAAASMVWSINA